MSAPEDSAYIGPDAAARGLVDELATVLGDFGDRCVIIGGVAHNYWREPRYTKDVDFTLAADRELFELLKTRMLSAGFIVGRLQDQGEPSGPGFVRFSEPGTNKIVEFLTAKTEFQDLLIRRGVRVAPDHPLRVATPEDIIVLKLIANRPQDHVDTLNLGQIDGLDWDYIRHWCREWSVEDRADGLLAALEHDRASVAELFAQQVHDASGD